MLNNPIYIDNKKYYIKHKTIKTNKFDDFDNNIETFITSIDILFNIEYTFIDIGMYSVAYITYGVKKVQQKQRYYYKED